MPCSRQQAEQNLTGPKNPPDSGAVKSEKNGGVGDLLSHILLNSRSKPEVVKQTITAHKRFQLDIFKALFHFMLTNIWGNYSVH